MADAKKCDVCGRFYTDDDKKFIVGGHKVYKVSVQTVNRADIYTYDVCDRCAEDLYDLLEGKIPIREKVV